MISIWKRQTLFRIEFTAILQVSVPSGIRTCNDTNTRPAKNCSEENETFPCSSSKGSGKSLIHEKVHEYDAPSVPKTYTNI